MVKIIGKVYGVSKNTVNINKFLYNDFIERNPPYDDFRLPEENIPFFYRGKFSLRFDREIIDHLIENSEKLCEFIIENGVVKSVKPLKTIPELLQEMQPEEAETKEYGIDLIMEGKPKSERDKFRTVLTTLIEMEKGTGMASQEKLVQRLEHEFEINPKESKRLFRLLIREGTIYEPRKGYLKKT